MTEAKTILVTGATAGIGHAAALGLARQGEHALVLAVRDEARGTHLASDLEKLGAASVDLLHCDLSSLASVRAAADEFLRRHRRLDVLINDAGVFIGRREVSADGLEMMFATNHLGPFLLTNLLTETLVQSAPSRVITVTAPSTTRPEFDDLQGERRFSPTMAFGRSIAEKLLFTYALARRLAGRGVTVNAYHPGVTRTGLMHDAPVLMRAFNALMSVGARTPEQAARGLVELATSPDFGTTTGQLIHDGVAIRAPFIDDIEAQERLWAESVRLAGLTEVAA